MKKNSKYGAKSNSAPKYKSNNRNRNGSKDDFRKSDKASECATKANNNLDDIQSNDITWYNRNPNLFADATRVPFDKLAGAPIRTRLGYDYNISGHSSKDDYEAQSAMMTIEYVPTPGVCHTYSDAPNRAFRSIYSYIYSHTSGALQIQQGDIALVCTACKCNSG